MARKVPVETSLILLSLASKPRRSTCGIRVASRLVEIILVLRTRTRTPLQPALSNEPMRFSPAERIYRWFRLGRDVVEKKSLLDCPRVSFLFFRFFFLLLPMISMGSSMAGDNFAIRKIFYSPILYRWIDKIQRLQCLQIYASRLDIELILHSR